MWRIFTVTALIFFIPGCILGTISPVVVRLTLQNIEQAGNGIGKIYAFSTLGAIAGTFMTGFVLISWMGTRNIILVMGIILMVAALGPGALFNDAAFRSLTIGGGGYTFPRYMETSFPAAKIDVVEIDPQVTKVVYQHLSLPEHSRIRTFNTDGRWFVMNCKDQYDLIFADAFNDLSIPYHLTTKEFAGQLRDILAPKGVLMSNVIDNVQKGAFLPSFMKTLAAVFGEDNVRLISMNPDFSNLRISTFIVIAHKGTLDIQAFDDWLKQKLGSQAK